jgi:hypothetical protein
MMTPGLELREGVQQVWSGKFINLASPRRNVAIIN